MVCAFEVLAPRNPADEPILTGPLECNANPTGLSIEPKKFKLGFRVRDEEKLKQWLAESDAATHHLR